MKRKMEIFTEFYNKGDIYSLFGKYDKNFPNHNCSLIFYTTYFKFSGAVNRHIYITFDYSCFTKDISITVFFGDENEEPSCILKKAKINSGRDFIEFDFLENRYYGSENIKERIDNFFGKRICLMSGTEDYLLETLENIMKEFRNQGCIWKKVRI